MKKLTVLLLLIVLAAILMPSAAALEYDSAANKFIFSDSAATSQDIGGDYVAFARSVRLSGDVDGDVIAFGSNISIENASSKNIFAAGYDVTVAAGTAKNIYAGGTFVDVSSSEGIMGAYLAGSRVIFNGRAVEVSMAGGSVELYGVIEDEAVLRSDDITFGSDVSIGGTLTIYASSMPQLPSAIDESKVVFHKVSAPRTGYLRDTYQWLHSIWKVTGILSAILLAVLITLFKGGFIRESALAFPKKAGWAILWGFIAFVVVPIASVIAMITLVGTAAAVIVLIVYGIFLSLAPVITGAVLGRLIFTKMNRFLSAIIGAAVLSLIMLIPVVRVIVWLACAFYMLGLVVMSLKPYKEEKSGALQPPNS